MTDNKFCNMICPGFLAGRGAVALLVLRLVFGAAFVLHGMGKIQTPFTWMGPEAPVPGVLQGLAALSEFGGGIAMILGLFTPIAAFGLFCTMVVATFMVHVASGHPFVPGPEGGPSFELPLTYLAVSLTLMLIGPGVYSLDNMIFNRKKDAAAAVS